jgi:hypothetical protein
MDADAKAPAAAADEEGGQTQQTATKPPRGAALKAVVANAASRCSGLFARPKATATAAADAESGGGEPSKGKPAASSPDADDAARKRRRITAAAAAAACVVVLALSLGVGLGVGLRKKSTTSSPPAVPMTLLGDSAALAAGAAGGFAVLYPSNALPCASVVGLAYISMPAATANGFAVAGAVQVSGSVNCSNVPGVVFSGAGAVPQLTYSGVTYKNAVISVQAGAQFVRMQFSAAAVASGSSTASVLALSASETLSGAALPVFNLTASASSYGVTGSAGAIDGSAVGMALLLDSSACSSAAAGANISQSSLYYVNLPGLVVPPLTLSGTAGCGIGATAPGTLFSGAASVPSITYLGAAYGNAQVTVVSSRSAASAGGGRRRLLAGELTELTIVASQVKAAASEAQSSANAAANGAASAVGITLSSTQSGSDAPAPLTATFTPPMTVFGDVGAVDGSGAGLAVALYNISGAVAFCTATSTTPRAVSGGLYVSLPGLRMQPYPTPVSGQQFCPGSSPVGTTLQMSGAPTSVTVAGGVTSVNNALTVWTGATPGSNAGFSNLSLSGALAVSAAQRAIGLDPAVLSVDARSTAGNTSATRERTMVANVSVSMTTSDFQLNGSFTVQSPCSGEQTGTAVLTLIALGGVTANANLSAASCDLSSFTLVADLPAQAALGDFSLAYALLNVTYNANVTTRWNFTATFQLAGGTVNAFWNYPFTSFNMTALYPTISTGALATAVVSRFPTVACVTGACPFDMPDVSSLGLTGSDLATGLAAPTFTNMLVKFYTASPGGLRNATVQYVGAAGAVRFTGAAADGSLVMKRDAKGKWQTYMAINIPQAASGVYTFSPTWVSSGITALGATLQFTSIKAVRCSTKGSFFTFFDETLASVPVGLSFVFVSTQTITGLATGAVATLMNQIDTASNIVTTPAGNATLIGSLTGGTAGTLASGATLRASYAAVSSQYAIVEGLVIHAYSFFLEYSSGSTLKTGLSMLPISFYNGTADQLDVTADLAYTAPNGATAGSFGFSTNYVSDTPWTDPLGISSNMQVVYPLAINFGASVTAAGLNPTLFGLSGTLVSLTSARYPNSNLTFQFTGVGNLPSGSALQLSGTNMGLGRVLHALTYDLVGATGNVLAAPLSTIIPWLDIVTVAALDVSFNPGLLAVDAPGGNNIATGLTSSLKGLKFADLFNVSAATLTMPFLASPTSWLRGVQASAALDHMLSIGGVFSISGDAAGTTPPSFVVCAVPPAVAARKLSTVDSPCTAGVPSMSVNGYITLLGQSAGFKLAAAANGFNGAASLQVAGLDFGFSLALSLGANFWGTALTGSLATMLTPGPDAGFSMSVTAPGMSVVQSGSLNAVKSSLTNAFNAWGPWQTVNTALNTLGVTSLSGDAASLRDAATAAAVSALQASAANFGNPAAAFTAQFGSSKSWTPCYDFGTVGISPFTAYIGSKCGPTLSVPVDFGSLFGRRLLSSDVRGGLDEQEFNVTGTGRGFVLDLSGVPEHHARTLLALNDCIQTTSYSKTISLGSYTLTVGPYLSKSFSQSIDGGSFTFGPVSVPTGIDSACVGNNLPAGTADAITAVTGFAGTYAQGALAGLENGLSGFLNGNVFSVQSFAVAPLAFPSVTTELSATVAFTLLGSAHSGTVTLPVGADAAALNSFFTGFVSQAFTAATQGLGG